MSIFTGSGVALCTPFTKDNTFDGDVYERLITFQIRNGTAAIVSCGTTGEVPTLSLEEQVEVVRTAAAVTKKYKADSGRRIPVIAGAGGNNTAACIATGKALMAAGADALMYVTPYYNKTSQAGLLQHYAAINAQVDAPFIVYNVPSRTGLNIEVKTMVDISQLEHVVGVKEASGDISQIAAVIEQVHPRCSVYVGNDDQVLPTLALGGKGVISTLGNIMPRQMQYIVKSFMAGNIEASRTMQLEILPIVRLIFEDVNPMPVKAALGMLGFPSGPCRLPLTEISQDLYDRLETALKDLGVIANI